jgi:hypothetical protein
MHSERKIRGKNLKNLCILVWMKYILPVLLPNIQFSSGKWVLLNSLTQCR